jgi:hypothetical protein
MARATLERKAVNLYARAAVTTLFRRPVRMRNRLPLISFSFDDFPQSAVEAGGTILETHGFRATYYASLGLMGTRTPVGDIFSAEDLSNVVSREHELGCHTFAHCHSWQTAPKLFEHSILENRDRLKTLVPEASFKTFAYPKSGPRPHTKRRAARHFTCCRAGGQTYNVGVADGCLLSAYFLEQARHDVDSVMRLIDRNSEACGWLIFATHDVCDTPSRFGCSPKFFDDVVRMASRSGAIVLPVAKAWDVVCGTV